MSLIDKIRKARETSVEVGGHTFVVIRPTDEQALGFSRNDITVVDIVRRFTVGWDLIELDIYSGGGSENVPFSADLFGEWVADNPDVWEPLGNAIMAAYKAHSDKRSESVKN